mmetsp:Transcript_21403/g.59341  ORF Transcript_21403/g.59341 Transcript_21403/m.59341 type:complete len:566 (+) Transcript_21403:176-1873(+)
MGAAHSSADFDEEILPSVDSSDGDSCEKPPVRSVSCSSFTSTCLERETESLEQMQRGWADYLEQQQQQQQQRRELTLRSTLLTEEASVEYLIAQIQALPLDDRPLSLVLVSRIDDHASYGLQHHPLDPPPPIHQPMDQLFQLLGCTLQRLEIVNPHIETTMAVSMELLQCAMRHLVRLESLTLVRLELSDARPIKEKMLARNNATTLPSIRNANDSTIDDSSCCCTCNDHSSNRLSSLHLDTVSLSRHSCTELALGIQSYSELQNLHMEKCDFRGGFRTISHAIAKSPSRLRTLNLMMSVYPNVDALHEIAIILRGQDQLVSLNLDGMLYPGRTGKLFNDFLQALEGLSRLKRLSLNDWRIASDQKQALIEALAEPPSCESNNGRSIRKRSIAPQLQELNLLVTDGHQLVESFPIHGPWVQHLSRLHLQRLMVSVGKLLQARGPNDFDNISQTFYHNTCMTCFSDEEYFDHFYHPGIQQTIERNKRMARNKRLMLDAAAAVSPQERKSICPIHLWPKILAQTPTQPDEYELTSLFQLLSTRAHELPSVGPSRRRPPTVSVGGPVC